MPSAAARGPRVQRDPEQAKQSKATNDEVRQARSPCAGSSAGARHYGSTRAAGTRGSVVSESCRVEG